MLVMLTLPATAGGSIGAFAQWQNTTDMDGGPGVGLKYNIQFLPIISFEARASWLRLHGGGRWADANAFPLEAVGRAKLGLLYGGVGGGYYIFSGDDFPPKNSLGTFILGGAEFSLLGLGAFSELRYLILKPDEKENVGGSRDLSGIGANVGIILSF